MHFGLEQYVPLALYLGAVVAFLLSLFWRPQAGLYFLIPLLPLQTIRYRLMDLPLGNKLIDILLLGVVLGSIFKGGFRFAKTPMNKLLLFFGLFCYVQLWRGSFFLNVDMPVSISDPRFSNWKNYMVMFILFAVVVSVIKEVKQIQIIILLMCLSVFAVDKGFHGTMSDRDLSHFSYEVRDGGPLGYAGVNGVATFEAEFMLFLLGMNAFQKRKSYKVATWLLVIFSGYCLLFSFSREAYVGILVGLLFLGLMKQRWVLLALAVFLLSWQTMVPTAVKERVLMTYDKSEQQLDTSAQDRVTLWNDAMDLFHQNPVIGAGFDTYQWQHRVGIYTDTHNYFLKVLVETGVTGLLFFLLVLAKASRQGIRLFTSAQDPFLKSLGLGFSLLMACVFVVNFFGDRWLYIEVNGFLWVLLACVVRGQMIENQRLQEAIQPVTEFAVADPAAVQQEDPVLV
ncbi:MAG TPA: O-antigen ligase family protein [Candidatus Angelobacter sp.]|nr:O-antigen ligase family protein [Candidatus Angelobacter sp.]